MRHGTGLSRTEFALLARPNATSRATDSLHPFESRLLALHSCRIMLQSAQEKWSFLYSELDSWRKIASLTMSALSISIWAHFSVHSMRSAISLSRKKCRSNQGSLAIVFQVRNLVRPMHLFGHNVDHDYYFELPREEERDALSITRCLTAHHGDVRAVPRANRTFSSARNPIPGATSSTDEPPVYEPWPPWRSSVPAAGPGGKTCCAIPGRCAP